MALQELSLDATQISLLFGVGSTLIAAGFAIGRGALSTGNRSGELSTTLVELSKVVQQMQVDIKDIQRHIYTVYPLSHEDARRLLHYHDKDGNVCYA